MSATTPSPDASPDSGEAEESTFCNKCGYLGPPTINGVHQRPKDGSECPYLCRSLPSPSPAIVKEAGEVEVEAEDNARADAWADFRDQYLEDGNDGYVAAPAYERARTAFDEGWAGGRAPAFSHARAALSASNAAQVSK